MKPAAPVTRVFPMQKCDQKNATRKRLHCDRQPFLVKYASMNDFAPGLQLIGFAYLIGSIPFGYLVGRFVGKIDIRQQGSGNIGATNVGRVLGSKWGLFVFALDLLKGLVPVALLSKALIGAAS